MPNRRKELAIEPTLLWYLVGLIATDGNLSKDGRHISITLKDYDMLIKLRNAAGLGNKIGMKKGGFGTSAHQLQFSNVSFYQFLKSIGLFPNKSLTLRPLAVLNEYFADFLRGVIDGDGCIRRWVHPSNQREQWSLRIYSGSRAFLDWLKNAIEMNMGALGRIYVNNGVYAGRAPLYVIKFGKVAAKCILEKCYENGKLSLSRKHELARQCVLSRIGWRTSRTVVNVPG